MIARIRRYLSQLANYGLRQLNPDAVIRMLDREVTIPSLRGLAYGASEPWMLELLRGTLRARRGIFLDVGVNLGQTLVKVKAVESDRQYVGFEPNPVCVFYVHELIKANRFENCDVIPVGLFTRDCVLSLNLITDSAADSSASLIEGFRPDSRTVSRVLVPVFRFESVSHLLKSQEVGVIKIDVEGAELEVVTTLLELIKQNRPVILIEVLPSYTSDNAFRVGRQDQLQRLLFDSGYSLFRVDKSGQGSFLGVTKIDEIGVHSDLTKCDYLVVPSEQVQQFLRDSDSACSADVAARSVN